MFNFKLGFKKRIYFILTIVVFCLGFFVRYYELSNVPNGLYPDETALGYNAYSILKTGKDEYGDFLPLYFRSFDDYKLPVYIYSTALSIKTFGVNEFAIRFPSALFGSLTVIALYFLILSLSKNRKLALISSFFLSVNPWHSFFSHAGYEVNVATSLIVFGTLFFVMGANKKNNYYFFTLSILFFVLSIYTYNVTRLISPILFFMLVVLYYKKITTVSKKLLISMLCLFLLGLIPFIVTFIILQSHPGFSSHQDALLIGKEVQAEIMQTRSYFASLPNFLEKLLFNYWTLVGWRYIQNLVSFFSTSFFFIIGANHSNQNIGGGFGMFYYFEFPLILLGVYYAIKRKLSYLNLFLFWFLIIFFVGSIIKSVPSGTRTYLIVIPLTVFSSYGMYVLIEKVIGFKHNLIKNSILIILTGFMTYSYLFYFLSYFVRFPIEYAKEWRSEDKKLVAYIQSIEKNFDKVIFDESAEFFYTSFLFYGKFPPQSYQQYAEYKQTGLVNILAKVGKYEFRQVDWGRELITPKTLFISGKMPIPEKAIHLKTISYPTRPVVLYYDRKIGVYPVTDTAYEIIKSKDIMK